MKMNSMDQQQLFSHPPLPLHFFPRPSLVKQQHIAERRADKGTMNRAHQAAGQGRAACRTQLGDNGRSSARGSGGSRVSPHSQCPFSTWVMQQSAQDGSQAVLAALPQVPLQGLAGEAAKQSKGREVPRTRRARCRRNRASELQ